MGLRLAKITPPRASSAVPRRRLWSRLDAARRRSAAIWIGGPPGAGKTTLVASWLAARRCRPVWLRVDPADEDLATLLHYLGEAARPRCRRPVPAPAMGPGLDPEVVARRYLSRLLTRLPAGTVLVLDDAGHLADDGLAARALRVLVEELPTGISAVLVGRGEPPRALAAAVAAGRLAALGASELRLTAAEVRALAERHGVRASRARAERLHRDVDGWAAGLVLLLARERRDAASRPELATLDYFAGEVFDRADAATRRILLETALLDAPTASLACASTGDPAASRVLAALARRGVFTHSHGGDDPAFEFHGLFRAFLLRRGRDELPPGRADEVRRAAAVHLGARGGADAEAAFALLAEAGAVDEAAALVRRLGPGLLAEGRSATLEAWLARLPPERSASDAWLIYLGAMARLGRAPEAARDQLDRARAMFERQGDATGVWLAWAAAVEAIMVASSDFTSLSARVAQAEALRARLPPPSAELDVRVTLATLAALVHHDPGHPALRAAATAARHLAVAPGDDRARLVAGVWYQFHAGWWLGDVDGVRPVVDALGPAARARGADPVAAVLWLTFESPFRLLDGDEAAAARVGAEARALAEREGVRTWNPALVTQAVWGALARDDLPGARAGLDGARALVRPGNDVDLSTLRMFEAAVALRSGSAADAALLATEARELAERAGFASVHVFAEVIRARAAACDPSRAREAEAALAAARRKIAPLGSRAFEHLLALVEADRALRAGAAEEAREALARAVPGARQGSLHARYLFSGEELGRLWALALRRGVAPETVRELLRSRRLVPPPDAGEEWPWPVRIRALGRFEVERDGAAVPVSRSKPMELLKVLVALGGREVDAGVLADALWPEAEADAARHALETALYRLRRLVGADVVVQRDLRISIVADRCWVDARELEARLAAASATLERRGPDRAAHDVEGTAALYRGPLLADEAEAWAADARERLRRRVARWAEAVAAARACDDPAALRDRLAAADPALAGRPALRSA